MERHEKFTKCPGCDDDTKPEFPIIKFQIGLVPAHQIKAEKAIGLQRKSQIDAEYYTLNRLNDSSLLIFQKLDSKAILRCLSLRKKYSMKMFQLEETVIAYASKKNFPKLHFTV